MSSLVALKQLVMTGKAAERCLGYGVGAGLINRQKDISV
jgi:hypothetical protein